MASRPAHSPVRTCVGCRGRATATELLRVVVTPGAAGPGSVPSLVPDPRRRAAGRGAWVHPDQRCVDLAERRRAFARALRVPGPVDPAPVTDYLSGTARPVPTGAHRSDRPSGDTAP